MWWLLLACVADPDPDLDHDGLPVSRDCDDGNPAVLGVASYWRDVDQDGFGGDVELRSCTQPTGTSVAGGDCADADPIVNPNAVEVCNTIDDDCDGVVDAADAVGARVWYPDADRDGWGETDGAVRACALPPGHVRDPGDCDDGDGRAWPGSPEVCGDGVDQDCDGHDGSCWLGGELMARAADATILGDADYVWAGYALDGAGDVNGDGFDDVVVGAYGWSPPSGVGPAQSGGAFVFHGPVAGTHLLLDASASYAAIGAGDAAGMRLAAAGDLDGDGADDVLVAAPYHDGGGMRENGAVFAVGGEAGLTSLDGLPRVLGAHEYAYAGLGLTGVGDWTGDGQPDVAWSEWGVQSGDVRVVPGPLQDVTRGAEASWLQLYAANGTQLSGSPLNGVGDLDGDGLPELAVSAQDAQAAGSVWIVSAPLAGYLAVEDVALSLGRGGSGDEYGNSVSGRADLDADGYGDLLVGAPGRQTARGRTGAALVYLGPFDAAGAAASAIWAGEDVGDRAGEAVATLGDADGDGREDLLVGAPHRGERAPGAGAAYVLLEGTSGLHGLDEAELTVFGSSTNAALGSTVADAGDVDGDGFADFLLGSPAEDGPSGRYAGAAYLFLGAPR